MAFNNEPHKESMQPQWIVTGADSHHFANSRLLVASWWETNRHLPLAYCDFGLTQEQLDEIRSWPVTLLPIPPALARSTHAWRYKAGLIQYLAVLPWKVVTWIDADAILLTSLGDTASLTEGYDLLVDAHVMAIGEITLPETAALLPPMDPRDAYFGAGFWITSSRRLLATWDEFCGRAEGIGNLWEGDAFVAAVYDTKTRVRTVCGNIWHVRGKTSIQTSEITNGRLTFGGFPCVVLHANAEYTLREDERRVFVRETLREIQDQFERRFFELRARNFDRPTR
jgi:hypothetical protein